MKNRIEDAISRLFVCQLHKMDRNIAFLPEGWQGLISHFYGGEANISSFFNDYIILLPFVAYYSAGDTLDRYISLCVDFAEDEAIKYKQIVSVAVRLVRLRKYEEALVLFQEIPADSEAADAEFWKNTGMAFYGLGRYEEAEECLRNTEQTKEILSYIAWCQEMIDNGD